MDHASGSAAVLRLYRRFALIAAAVTLGAALALYAAFAVSVRALVLQDGARANAQMTQVAVNGLERRIGLDVWASLGQEPPQSPGGRALRGRISAVLEEVLNGTEVRMVAILDRDGRQIYASASNSPAADERASADLHNALRGKLVARWLNDRRIRTPLGVHDTTDLILTYGPVHDRLGNPVALIELASDVAPVAAAIRSEQARVLLIVGLVFAALYVAVILIVRYGARLIHRQQQELEVVQQRLRAEKETAQRATEAKSRFLAHMSHEIRTPMNGVLGMADLLAREALSRPQRDYVEIITRAGRNLMTILNDILDSAKVEAGLLDVKQGPFDAVESARLCADLQSARALQKGLRLHADLARAAGLRAIGEPVRVQQVLTNLISNAIRFTDAGEVRLTVAPTPCRTRLEFSVADTGIGIDERALGQLFKPFVQLCSSGRRRAEGTGLGLWISSELVRLMGGRLEASSSPGSGSRFWFSLDLAAARAEGTPAVGAENIVSSEQPLRVLIVEDEPVNQLVAQAQVAALGHLCTLAASGEDAVRVYADQRFDVVLMDRHMPGIDGLEAARRIRAIARGKGDEARIIAMSASVMADERHLFEAAGIDGFVPKPYTQMELARVLGRCESAA